MTSEGSTYRSPWRRDYSRVVHSAAFRKLQGKTQLFPGHESDFFRNRLTHSLEVAQVAKTIALRINATNDYFRENPIDLDIVETAGLAHDLGHPPFGHNGEQALDKCMHDTGGFEGNAQTLRILGKLVKRDTPSRKGQPVDKAGRDVRAGLNLTSGHARVRPKVQAPKFRIWPRIGKTTETSTKAFIILSWIWSIG